MIVNHNGISSRIVKAIKGLQEDRDVGNSWATISELSQPARAIALQRQCGHKLEIEASDLVRRFVGQCVHKVMANAHQMIPDALVEKRLFATIDDTIISGQPDMYCDNTVVDYKTITASAYNRSRDDWAFQQNAYALLLRKKGHKVQRLLADVLIIDWNPIRAQNPGYPELSAFVAELPMWGDDTTAREIQKRIERLKLAMLGEITDCTAEERWQTPDIYALWHRDGTRAISIKHKSWVEANQEAMNRNEKKPGHYVETRPGERNKCAYCDSRKVCASYREYLTVKANIKAQRCADN